jgi:hypothetical protein
MAENIELLIQIQEQIIQCRRLAASVHDPKTARLLYDLANEIEQRAREADRAGRNKFATAAERIKKSIRRKHQSLSRNALRFPVFGCLSHYNEQNAENTLISI